MLPPESLTKHIIFSSVSHNYLHFHCTQKVNALTQYAVDCVLHITDTDTLPMVSHVINRHSYLGSQCALDVSG